jgi:hypothetical protein
MSFPSNEFGGVWWPASSSQFALHRKKYLPAGAELQTSLRIAGAGLAAR